MRRELGLFVRFIFAAAMLVLLGVAPVAFCSSLDQTYVQTLVTSGQSTMEKTMGIVVFSNQLPSEVLARMSNVCSSTSEVVCSVDIENKTIAIKETLSPGAYYTFTADYGFPFTTYTLTISRVPTDQFTNDLEKVLILANISKAKSDQSAVTPVYLENNAANKKSAEVLRAIGVNITYRIIMPGTVSQADAGAVHGAISGSSVDFDFVQVLDESKSIVVKSTELNLGATVMALGALVLIWMALVFRKGRTKPETKDAGSNTIKKKRNAKWGNAG